MFGGRRGAILAWNSAFYSVFNRYKNNIIFLVPVLLEQPYALQDKANMLFIFGLGQYGTTQNGYSLKAQCCLLCSINYFRYMGLELKRMAWPVPHTMLLATLDQSLPLHGVTA